MRKLTFIFCAALLSLQAMAQLSTGPGGFMARAETAEGTVVPSTINVTTVVGMTATETITITNTGTVTFVPLTAFISDYGYFSVDSEALHVEIQPTPANNVQLVTVTFAPNHSGTFNATLNVKIGAVIHYVSMHGTALERGDADGDGHVTVKDISVIISALLEQQDYAVSLDVDQDGMLTVRDISTLIAYLLSGEWPEPITPPEMTPGVVTVNGVSFKMMPVKGGSFTMGATAEQGSNYNNNETPTHKVTLSSFYMAETEVTQALWRAVMGTNPCYFPGDIMRPIENVTWNNCQQFITKLNEMTGYNFRLPTEAEWEYAARGGQASNGYIYAGSNNADEVAWHGYNSSNTTHPVASLTPNELGLYDMTGNVFEWCQDWFGDYTAEDQVNPTGPESGTMRVCRGGAWAYDPVYARNSYRYYYSPTSRNVDLGFRLVIDSTFTPPTQPPFTLSCLEMTLEVEQVVKVGINNGSGNYSVASAAAGIVGCAIEGDSIVLTGLAEGTTRVTLTDTQTEAQITFPVTVTPKDNSETFIVNGIPFKMVPVEGGSFLMGATPEQIEQYYTNADERPVHEEWLSDFMIGQTEVTQALWLAVMGSNPSEFSTTLKHPVEQVSWNDCQEFIRRLNALTGREFRLPTEPEWEYAARGGVRSEGHKYAGSDNVSQVGWYFMNAFVVGESSPNYGTHEVAKLKANELGLYDMSGNVSEWCQDLYAPYTEDPFTTGTPSNDSTRVVRGGCWSVHDHELRLSCRNKRVETAHNTTMGLRLALDATLDPARLLLSEDTLSMDVGTSQRVKILNGSGQYTLNYDTTLVSCQVIEGDILVVTSKAAGQPVITITDELSHGQATLSISAIEAMTITVNGVSIRMVKVEGGSFMMGSDNGTDSEKPVHKVNVSTFYMSEVEVPQKLWKAVLGYTPQDYIGDEYPYLMNSATNTTLLNKLNQKTGLNFRLPTEAEWEYAARGGNKSQGYRYAGSDNLDEVAWNTNNCDGTPQPVGTKKPNELYLYDMSGNVFEWCLDGYYEYDIVERTDPEFISTYTFKIYKGGCAADAIDLCRPSWRSVSYPSNYNYGGLRLVLGGAIDLNALALSSSKKSVTVGGETSVTITNGSGSYTLDYDSGIVSCQVADNNLTVTGTAPGTATVVVTDQQTQQQCTLEVNVIVADTYTVNGITFTMVPVEGGTFTMGATEEQGIHATSDEKPAHEVTLSDFAIGQTEVTQALWNAVMSNTSDPTKLNPKVNITFEEIKTFIGRLNALTGVKFRLPTEAEWEYAARGGNKSEGYMYSGGNDPFDIAWLVYNSGNHLNRVATKEPNELGLYDMSGNVNEYCMDYFNPYTAEAQTDPCSPLGNFAARVVRGGSYNWANSSMRTTSRYFGGTTSGSNYVGFRLTISSAQQAPEITATPRKLYMNVGEQDSVTVKYGSGSYVLSKDKDIVTWQQDSDKVVFTATGTGNVTVTIEDAMSHDQTTVDITIIQPTVYTVNGVSFTMIEVDGGTFTMGKPSTAYTNTYGHEVTLSDYSIGQTEVTIELWQAVMGGTATTNLQNPKASISWNKCQEFIMKLNALTGENFRLPTEAEWEFAALGGNSSNGYTYSGSNVASEVAWYDNSSSRQVHAVGLKKPNELGLYDMSGNVREYCLDLYEYYPRTAQVNPTGATYGPTIVARGGDYFNSMDWCEVKTRYHIEPTAASNLRGLRLAKGDAVAPPAVTLTQNDLALGIGQQGQVEIAYGTDNCRLEYDESIVTCMISGMNIMVIGKKVGAADVIIHDDSSHSQTTLHVLVKSTQTFTVNGVSFEMINLPGGMFLMGGTPEMNYNATSYYDEKPVHEVTLSPFYIGTTEVTQALWVAVMGSNPSEFNSDPQCPVDNVSWDDCQQFISQLNALTGKHFRLPTEAEWEYAARGGNSQRFRFSGSNTYSAVAWYSGNSSSTSHPVAQLQANAIGAYDMTGNIAEWCQDWKGSYSAEPQTDPTGPATGTKRVVRGSSWSTSSQSELKNSYRGSANEGRYNNIGLRLVMVRY